jgi:hypothetical protein
MAGMAAVRAGAEGGEDVQRPQRRFGLQRVDDQPDAERATGGLHPHQQDAPVDRVDHHAAHQGAGQQRPQLRQPHQPDRQRRARQQVHLQRHRDHG